MLVDKCYLINLDIRPDRLERFHSEYPGDSPLGKVDRWPAVHGDTVTPPSWWRSGNGAWGCYRSHLQILEHALNNRIDSYIVFEDDACFKPDFSKEVAKFFSELPSDWEMVYLGGQLLHETDHPPIQISDNVLVPYNVNRTHCFGLRGRKAMLKIYHHITRNDWVPREHIDHHIGRLHEAHAIKTYVPARWMVGQRGGSSNISGKTHGDMWFADPVTLTQQFRRGTFPVVLLRASRAQAEKFFEAGWHPGFWRDDETGYDHGIQAGVRSYDKKSGIKNWYSAISQEVISHGFKGACCWHPEITLDDMKSAGISRAVEIIADTAERAIETAAKLEETLVHGSAL